MPRFAALLLICCSALAFAADDAENLKQMEQRWARAAATRDVDTIASMLADDFISTDSAGNVTMRDDYVAHLRASKTKMESEELSDLRAQVYGDAAVVTGQYDARGSNDGKSFARRGRFTDTWVRRSGQWKCVAGQTTDIK